MTTVVTTIAVVVTVGLVALHLARFRGARMDEFRPAAAWNRAGIYVGICWIVSSATGVLDRILHSPVATAQQLDNPAWWVWTLGSLLLIVCCYWGIWIRWTLTFDRPRNLPVQIAFGLLWGSGSGQLFASALSLAERGTYPGWLAWLIAYAAIAVWQGLWQDLYWDIWVAPEHDTPKSIKLKVPASHIPNVTVTLTYLALYRNEAIFVGLQALALTAASVGMRFPAPWERRAVLAPRVEPGPFGRPHAAGFVSDDPDPYATQRARRAAERAVGGARERATP